MKRLFPVPAILLLLIICPTESIAQEAGFTTGSGMTIGFGLGSSYQVSDIKNSVGAGFNFNLGSYLYKKDGAALSADWKFRFLAGENRAHDHRINTDDTYSNIRLRHFNYDLELGLTLNRLRERTRIVLSGFAGIGITHGITNTDLYNSSGNPYDYSVINPNQDRSQIRADLLALSDKEYETKLVNKAAVLPTAGIYLGYQFTSSFSMGIIHKINFSLTENNGAFGINIDNNPLAGSCIDMNHYTSLGFTWILGGRSSGGYSGRDPGYVSPVPAQQNYISTERPSKIIYDAPVLPEIDITIPYKEIHRTQDRNVDITARVRRIENKENIRVRYENSNTDFEFTPESGRINFSVFMARDTSLLTISGTNNSGSASDSLLLVFALPDTTVYEQGKTNAEAVTTNPARVNVNTWARRNTNRNVIRINENTGINRNTETNRNTNISRNTEVNRSSRRSNVRTTENNRTNRVSRRNIERKENENRVISREEIIEESDIRISDEPCPAPSVKFSIGEIKSKNATHKLTGTIKNIKQISGITMTVNGSQNTDFQYNATSGQISTRFNFNPGSYTITVFAKNDCGEDSGSARVVVKTVVEDEEDEDEGGDEGEDEEEQQQQASSIRINPGNSAWQFCLVTPGGTYNRDNLRNENFSYSGPASSLYILPIGGGGTAIVNGRSYNVRSGRYYLFTGSLQVSVSTNHPGSMGHWSVTIKADRAPASGNGNKRPKSPCENNH